MSPRGSLGAREKSLESVRALPSVLIPPAVLESLDGHGARAAPAAVRLASDVVAELALTGGVQILLAAVVLQRPLVRLASLQPLDDLL